MTEFTPILTTPERIDADFPSAPLLVEDLDEYGVVTDSRVALLRAGPVDGRQSLTHEEEERDVVLHGIRRRLVVDNGQFWISNSLFDHPAAYYLPVLKCFHAIPTETHTIPFRELEAGMILCGQQHAYVLNKIHLYQIFFFVLDCCVIGWPEDRSVVGGWSENRDVIAVSRGTNVDGLIGEPDDADGLVHILVERVDDFILK